MHFLVVQSTYEVVQVGFFKDFVLLDQKIIQKFQAARQLVSSIKELLDKHAINFENLSFIGTNQGPAPFNSLRILLATINGLAFATNVPLVGVNGIKALYANSTAPQTVVLLNAFNNEVYYAYKKHAQLTIGVARIHDVLPIILLDLPHGQITFLGNGAQLFNEPIIATFGARAHIPSTTISEVSLETLAYICLNKFNQNEIIQHTQPLYLKRAI